MSCCIPADVDLKEKVPSEVNKKRKPQNVMSGACFVACVIIQYGFAIATLNNVNATPCNIGVDVGDLMSGVTSAGSAMFGTALNKHGATLAGSICLALFLGGLWILLLQKLAHVIVWGTLFLEFALLIAASAYFQTLPYIAAINVTCWTLLFIGLLVVFSAVKQINKAADMLSAAAYAIQANCSLVATSMILLLLMCGYCVVPIAGLAASLLAGEWQQDSNGFCTLYQPQWVTVGRYWNGFMLSWVFFFTTMQRTYIIAVTTAMWYWDEPGMRVTKAVRWAFSTSFGSLSLGGLIVALIDRCNRWAESGCYDCMCICTNPLYIIFRIVYCMYKELLNALARFCVVMMAITGDDFYVSVGRSYYTLKGRFGTLFVIDSVAKIVLYSGATFLAIGLWFFAWMTASQASADPNERDMFAQQSEYFETFGFLPWLGQVLWVLMWILACTLMYYPIVGILVLVFFGWIFGTTFGYPFVIGLFTGCLANYFFTFFADTILDVAMAMFVVVRIDAKNGVRADKRMRDGQAVGGDPETPGTPAYVGKFFVKLSDAEAETELVTVTTVTTTHLQMVPQNSVMIAQPAYGPNTVMMAQPVPTGPMMAHPMMAQPVQMGGQVMMAQPMMAQPMYAQPMMAQPMMAQPMIAQPMLAQPIMAQPAGLPRPESFTMAQPMAQQPGQNPQYQPLPDASYGMEPAAPPYGGPPPQYDDSAGACQACGHMKKGGALCPHCGQ